MDYVEKVAKGSLIVFIMSIIGMIIGYLLRVFLSRNLSLDEFGLLYAILALIGIFGLFGGVGLNQALAKFIPEFLVKKKQEEIKSSITFSLAIQLIVTSIIVFFIFLFADFLSANYFHAEASLPLKILSLSFLIGVFTSVFSSALQGFGNMKYYSLIEPLRIFFVLISVILLIQFGIVGAAYSYFIASLLVSLIAFFMILKIFPFFETKCFFTKKLLKKLLLFGLPILIGGLGGIILGYTDTITITYFRSLHEVGFYHVALPTAQLLFLFISSLVAVLFPTISEMWTKGQKVLLANAISLLVKFTLLIILPFAFMMIVFPDIIIRLLFGEVYLPAAIALQTLAIGAIFYTIAVIFSTTLTGIGKPVINTKIIFIIAAFDLITNILLVPIYGIFGAAITTLFSYAIWLALSFHFLRKNIRVSLPSSQIVRIFFGSIITLLIIFLLKEFLIMNPWLELVTCFLVGFIFYFSFMVFSKVVTKEDMKILAKAKIYPLEKIFKIFLKFAK